MNRITLEERLERLSIPEPNSGCTLWIGGIDRNRRQCRACNRAAVARLKDKRKVLQP